MAQEALAVAEATKAEEHNRLLQVELQEKLQELAAADAATNLAFAEQRKNGKSKS